MWVIASAGLITITELFAPTNLSWALTSWTIIILSIFLIIISIYVCLKIDKRTEGQDDSFK